MSPGSSPAVARRAIVSGVARRSQSRPQRDQRSGSQPLRRASASPAELKTPYGGR